MCRPAEADICAMAAAGRHGTKPTTLTRAAARKMPSGGGGVAENIPPSGLLGMKPAARGERVARNMPLHTG